MGLSKDRRRVDLNEEYYVCMHSAVDRNVGGVLMDGEIYRGWPLRISITGNRRGWRGSKGNTMVSCSRLHTLRLCTIGSGQIIQSKITIIYHCAQRRT